MQAKTEKNEESDKKTMTEKEYQVWVRRYERNMCPADLYDDITHGHEDLVAPIWKFRRVGGSVPPTTYENPKKSSFLSWQWFQNCDKL